MSTAIPSTVSPEPAKKELRKEDKELFAVLCSCVEQVILALTAGADPDAVNDEGTPALIVAWEIHKGECVDIALALLTAGANPDARGELSTTLLHKAAECRDFSLLLALKQAKASVLADDNLDTPLHLACKDGSLPAVQILLSMGADINAADADGRTPVHIAIGAEYSDVALYLLEEGADATLHDNDGNTPLHTVAAMRDMGGVLKALLAKGCNWRISSRNGLTALEVAKNAGVVENVEILARWEERKAVEEESRTEKAAAPDSSSST